MSRTGLALPALALACAMATGCHVDLKVKRLPSDQPIVLGFVSAGEANGKPGFPVDPDVLVGGARIFDERCSPCHGAQGAGDGPLASVLPLKPRNYQKDEFKWGTRPSEIVETIRHGRSDVMPAFEGVLTAREIWAVSYVVWSWIPEERRQYDDPAKVAKLK